MRVLCVKNDVAKITEAHVRERLVRSIHLGGPDTDLKIGREYDVQAIERRDSGTWLFLHTVTSSDYPYPYPAEMFEVVDSTVPQSWSIGLQSERGTVEIKRLAIRPWACDDGFYERLVEGDARSMLLYRQSGED